MYVSSAILLPRIYLGLNVPGRDYDVRCSINVCSSGFFITMTRLLGTQCTGPNSDGLIRPLQCHTPTPSCTPSDDRCLPFCSRRRPIDVGVQPDHNLVTVPSPSLRTLRQACAQVGSSGVERR